MAVLGTKWDEKTDYQAIINDAVSKGDYSTAAQAERLRNQKIDATGSSYEKTNKYSDYLDYGTIGKSQMSEGASWEDVLDTYNSRGNKIKNDSNLKQYDNDAIQQSMWQYILNGIDEENRKKAQDEYAAWLEQANKNKPSAYDGAYDEEINSLLKKILNRDDFSYDVENDPLYKQYAAMYRREGDRAMRETMANAAASAGGMNSYAITAAQQAQNYYNSQLNDKIPELYQLAYEMYLGDKESQVQDLGLLQQMDATQYGRYRDTMNDFYNDKSFAYGVYNDAVQQGNWQTNYDNSNLWATREWEAGQAQTALENSEKDRAEAEEDLMFIIEKGGTPPPELIKRAGKDEATVNIMVAAAQKDIAAKNPKKGSDDDDYVEDEGNGYTGIMKGAETALGAANSAYTVPVEQAVEMIYKSDGKKAVEEFLKEMLEAKEITQTEYNFYRTQYMF